MKHKIYQVLLSFSILVIMSSCNTQTNEAELVSSANFKVSSETIYLDQSFTFEAKDTLGNKGYEWDFGDGTLIRDKHKVSHQYLEPGVFTVKLKVNGLAYSINVNVLPGRLSYQIQNNSTYSLNVLTYLDSYGTGCTERMDLNWKNMTDSIFATITPNSHFKNKSSHIFGISIFVNNSEYTFPDPIWIDDFKHSVITITDSTKLSPRMYSDVPEVTSLRELYR